jgi:hypothetical protein
MNNFYLLAPPLIPGPPETPPTIDFRETVGLGLKHGNAYVYSYINLLKNMTLTAGVSYDHAESEFIDDTDNFNPKFGIVWNPFPRTTIRAAVFRTLTRTLITGQTLEPTQVAGFNQFYADFNLTEAWRYGGAIDQHFTRTLYGGVEFSKRTLKVPWLSTTATGTETRESDWDEYLGRGYLFWAPHEWLTLSAEYRYERVKREEPFVDGAVESDTHRVPLGINFFHPSGMSGKLGVTYYHQDGEFGGFYGTDPIQEGSESFWLVDISLNYRLPKRYGFITVGATNLLDKDFRFFDTDINNASIQPDR